MTTAFDLQFSEVNAAALRLFPGLLYQWFPGGIMHGEEYDVRNPARDDRSRGSFRINCLTGLWSDFATDLRGRSPISLYATFFCDGNHPEAARQIARQIGLLDDAPPDPAIARLIENLKTKPVEDKSAEAGWTQIPVPKDAPLPPIPAGCPAWTYFTAQGQLLGYVARLEKADGGKKFLPVTYWRNADGIEVWRHKQFVRPLPIYNRQALQDDQRPVLIVEGEKAADAGAALFLDMTVISWPQGSSSAAYVDWSELRGRHVALLPDNDEPGRQAMRKIADKLLALGCGVFMSAVEAHRPVGWDVADGKASGDWADEKTAQTWLDRLPWTQQGGEPGVEKIKTPKDERLDRALARAAGKGPQYAPQAAPLMPVDPLPIPILAQFEAELSRRVDITHPLAAQQVALAVAAHACARQGKSTSNDPCSLFLALYSQSIGEIKDYFKVVFRLFESAELRASVRQTRISTTNALYNVLYLNPALLYLSTEYGGMVHFARRQPAGSLEQCLNTMAELYGSPDVSVNLAEIGIKGFDDAGQDVLRAPTLNLLALLSQDNMTAIMKASELGRGALEQLQVVVLDADRQVLNDPEQVLPEETPFDPALVAMIRRLRRMDQPSLTGGQGYQRPELTAVRWGADMKTVYPALTTLAEGTTRAARPLLIAARSNIRRVATVLAMWADPDAPIITPAILNWVAKREVARLTTFLAQFDLLQSDDGKASAYQKVLQAISEEKHHGINARDLQRNCWAFRSLDHEKRDELLARLRDDDEIVSFIPDGKRVLYHFASSFVKTENQGVSA